MAEVNTDELKVHIERLHGGTATLVQSVPVAEHHDGVHVFNLAEHPQANRAYAWPYDQA